jgi:hypothetical protein
MTDAKHTQGPWQWYWRQEGREADCGVFWQERSGLAYSVCRAPRYVEQSQWEANARLIAAAPELLALLQETLRPGAYGIGSTLAERIEAAVAKAGGSQ